MEQYIIYTFGGVLLAICWFAISTLKNLNNSLKTNEFKGTSVEKNIPHLQASIGRGNIAFLLAGSVIALGLGAFYTNQKPKTHTPSVSEATKTAEAAETPKPVGPPVDLATATVLTDETSLKAGAETFKNLCAACHGQAGEGNIGPNMCDDSWIHGGEFKDLCKTITEGVPDKGMIAWASQLSGDQIKQVASYILSLEGSNPANQKPAQGTKFERKEKINFAIRPETVASVKIPTIPMKGNKKHGAELFNGILGCAHCHGSNAQGHVDNRNLRAIKKRYAGDAQKGYDTVMEIGRLGTAMPPWGHLSLEEKQDIKTYIFSIQE